MCNVFVVASVTMLYWSCSIVISGISHWPPKGWQRVKGCLLGRQNAAWMWTCFLTLNTHGGKLVDSPPPVHPPWDVPACCRVGVERNGASNLLRPLARNPQDWVPGWMYPPSSLWDTRTSQGEIRRLYNGVNQLKRLPGPPLCGLEWVQDLAWDILCSMEEHLQQSGVLPCQKEIKNGDPPEPLHPTTEMRSCMKKTVQEDDSYNCKLTKATEAHWWALVATHMLEERIKQIEPIGHMQTRQGNCHHSRSQGHLRRQLRGCQQRCH